MTFITTKVVYEALHFWEGADSIPEVSFLKHPHRHLFHIELTKRVEEEDREIEFIVFKHQIEKYLDDKYHHNFGGQSCEMIASELLEAFACEQVSVKEDNENGALCVRE